MDGTFLGAGAVGGVSETAHGTARLSIDPQTLLPFQKPETRPKVGGLARPAGSGSAERLSEDSPLTATPSSPSTGRPSLEEAAPRPASCEPALASRGSGGKRVSFDVGLEQDNSLLRAPTWPAAHLRPHKQHPGSAAGQLTSASRLLASPQLQPLAESMQQSLHQQQPQSIKQQPDRHCLSPHPYQHHLREQQPQQQPQSSPTAGPGLGSGSCNSPPPEEPDSMAAELLAGEHGVAVAAFGDRLQPRRHSNEPMGRAHSAGLPQQLEVSEAVGSSSSGAVLPPTPIRTATLQQQAALRRMNKRGSSDSFYSAGLSTGSDSSLSSPFASVQGDFPEPPPLQQPASVQCCQQQQQQQQQQRRQQLRPQPHARSSLQQLPLHQLHAAAAELEALASPAVPRVQRSSIDLLLDPNLVLAQHAARLKGTSRLSMDDRALFKSAMLPDTLRAEAWADRVESEETLDPGFPHVASAAMMRALADSTVTVVTGGAPGAPPGVPGLPAGYTASAWASSVVDQTQKYGALDTAELSEALQPEMLLDPDIHDVFGAHAGACSSLVPVSATPSWGTPTGSLSGTWPAVHVAEWGAPPGTSPGPLPPFALQHAGSAGEEDVCFRQARHLEPSTVHGQHSVTVHDPHCIVPSYNFLRQRQLAKARMASQSTGGYISEAKRVLSAAVNTAEPGEVATVETSSSGAIGPLLKYMHDRKHDDAALASSLQTLSLLVANSPNRSIVVSFKGQAMLLDAMRATRSLELQEGIVQLLWDLDAANKDCKFERQDMCALLGVLEGTSSATVASHILHFLHGCFTRACGLPQLQPGDLAGCAERLVREVSAHKHHLQDAAQYTVGSLLSDVLGHEGVATSDRNRLMDELLKELPKTRQAEQCQLLLTVLSCLAPNPRLRSAMVHCQARKRVMEFGHRMSDPRLRARALSLVKVLNKQELLETQSGGWYFGSEAATSSQGSSPRK